METSFLPPSPERTLEGWPDWSILIVDDEQGMLNFLVKTLAPRCHFVMSASSAEDGAQWLRGHHVDLVILDISLPGKSGVVWLKELREQGFTGEVILITAFADLDTAIEALRAGASDFILKPFRVPQILNAVKHCYERSRLRRENFVLRRAVTSTPGRGALVGSSVAMEQLRGSIARVAPVNSTVLLQGESGTGKELVARELHDRSARAGGPFVPVNCASVSPDLIESELFGHAKGAFTGAARARDGLFHYAQGGTLFLDEVAELPLPMQVKLLRAIQEKAVRPVGATRAEAVDLRILSATHRDLDAALASGPQVDVVDSGGRDQDQLEIGAGRQGVCTQRNLVDDGHLRATQTLDNLIRCALLMTHEFAERVLQRGQIEVALFEWRKIEENGATGHQLYLSKKPGLIDNEARHCVETGLCTGWNL